MQILEGHKGRVSDLAFSPDGRLLASCGTEGNIRIWDLATGTANVLKSGDQILQSIAFATDRKLVGQSTHGELHLYLRETLFGSQALIPRGNGFYSRGFSISPKAGLVAANVLNLGSRETKVWLWSTEGWECTELYQPTGFGLNALAFNPEGTQLATTLGMLDVSSGTLTKISRKRASSTCWSPSGLLFANMGYSENWVSVHDSHNGEKIVTLRLERKAVQDFAFSPDGDYLVVVSNEALVRCWRTDTWEECLTFAWNIGKLKCLAFDPEGHRAACGSHCGTILVWDWDPSQS